jgi:hypothetical protein
VVRWLSVVLRGLHLATVIGLGGAVLGAPLDASGQAIGVLASGAAMMAMDLWLRPGLLKEWSGASLLLKLAMVAWMAFDADQRLALFWLLVLWSTLFAHAPASFQIGRASCRERVS